ncbi:MAG: exodeoxyribonuclease V subunit gamma, partial [Rhodocyclaceae bacterium]
APETRWYSRDGSYRLRPCPDARAILGGLLCLYRSGLHEPLHFYPKAAWKFAAGGGSLSAAAGAWRSTRQRPYGEEEDPAYRLALRGIADPLDEAFQQHATAVFGTLLDYLEDPRL